MDIFNSEDSPPIRVGFQKHEVNLTEWIIPDYYRLTGFIGSGAYGMVCAGKNEKTKQLVAIKKFSRPFATAVHAKCAHRELRLLRLMKHDNIIKIIDMFTSAEQPQDMQDAYFVTPLMDTTLEKILIEQRKNNIQILNDSQIKVFTYQIVRALKYIHSAGIIHRDLKPGNIAINVDCDLKILDFGLARQAEAEMTGYVATRWYRAPEIMLNWRHYDQKVDIWSIGCIMAEMIIGRPIFDGKDNAIDQLTKIINVCGTPSSEFLERITSNEARNYIRTHFPQLERKDFRQYFSQATPQAIDFLDKTLEIDPDKRPTASEALQHPYFEEFHDETDEPMTKQINESIGESIWDMNEWRNLLWNEIVDFTNANDTHEQTSGQTL